MIDGRNDQGINDLIKQYGKVRKVLTGQGDDYTTECLLDYAYFKDNYRLITVDLSKQEALDADPRGIQQIIFQAAIGRVDNTKIRLSTSLRIFKRNSKSFMRI